MEDSPSRSARFRGLFDAHRDAVRAFCFRRLGPDHANDAVADVFVVAWRKIDGAPDGDEARLWLYGIARNVVRNAKRSIERARRLRLRLASVEMGPADSDPTIPMIRNEDYRRLLDAVGRLKPVEQELLQLRAWEEMSAAEISKVTGLTARAVESRLSRIRKKLAKALAQETALGNTRLQSVQEEGKP